VSYEPVVAEAARAAARQFVAQYGVRVEAEVEAALHSEGEGEAKLPGQYADPIAVASLIVAIATFLYPIYSDWKKQHGGKPAKDDLARKGRVEWRREHELTKDGEKIIEILSAEYTESGDQE
jgi:hypothetical protein